MRRGRVRIHDGYAVLTGRDAGGGVGIEPRVPHETDLRPQILLIGPLLFEDAVHPPVDPRVQRAGGVDAVDKAVAAVVGQRGEHQGRKLFLGFDDRMLIERGIHHGAQELEGLMRRDAVEKAALEGVPQPVHAVVPADELPHPEVFQTLAHEIGRIVRRIAHDGDVRLVRFHAVDDPAKEFLVPCLAPAQVLIPDRILPVDDLRELLSGLLLESAAAVGAEAHHTPEDHVNPEAVKVVVLTQFVHQSEHIIAVGRVHAALPVAAGLVPDVIQRTPALLVDAAPVRVLLIGPFGPDVDVDDGADAGFPEPAGHLADDIAAVQTIVLVSGLCGPVADAGTGVGIDICGIHPGPAHGIDVGI